MEQPRPGHDIVAAFAGLKGKFLFDYDIHAGPRRTRPARGRSDATSVLVICSQTKMQDQESLLSGVVDMIAGHRNMDVRAPSMRLYSALSVTCAGAVGAVSWVLCAGVDARREVKAWRVAGVGGSRLPCSGESHWTNTRASVVSTARDGAAPPKSRARGWLGVLWP